MVRHVLITGAGGYLGGELAQTLLAAGHKVSLVTSNPAALQGKYAGASVYANEALFSDWKNLAEIQPDVLIHCAFARRYRPDREIAESLAYSNSVFQAAVRAGVPALVNVSSQGVYGAAEEIRTEETPPAPTMIYTMAKYASEILLENTCTGSKTHFTSIRLDSIGENQQITRAFVKQAMETHKIKIVGGKQIFSFMAGRDFATAMAALLQTDPSQWEKVYNVGWTRQRYDIMQLAQAAAQAARPYTKRAISIELEPKDLSLFTGMDASRFARLTGWQPRYDIVMLFDGLFQEYQREPGKF